MLTTLCSISSTGAMAPIQDGYPVTTPSHTKTWATAGTYKVRVRARCVTHTSVVSSWSSELSVTILADTISTPSTPWGATSGYPGTSYEYWHDLSTSSAYHSVQYLFDWGDGTVSGWLRPNTMTASKAWASAGTYKVRVQARCLTHPYVVSVWSSALLVTILADTVSSPSTPSGPTSGYRETSYIYSTRGSTSSYYHPVQYLFDWGDGTDSGWLPANQTTASKTWASPGTYKVRVLARCATHPTVISSWSSELAITIALETVSTPSTLGGPTSGNPGNSYTYSTGGSTSSHYHPVQYLFDWGDGTDSGWLSAYQTTGSKSWASPGTYKVRVQARCSTHPSVVSGWSSELLVTIRNPDKTPPTGSISINNGAGYANSASVTLTISATDDSGVKEMCVSSTTSCSSWEPYAPSKSWALISGDGEKTVYVWFGDNAGNVTPSASSDTIILDQTPPASSITSPVNGATTVSSTYLIRGAASDAGSPVQKVEVSTDGGVTWVLASGTTGWSYLWTAPAEGSYIFRSRATDDAGYVEVPGPGISVTVVKRSPTDITLKGGQLIVKGNPFIIKGVGYSPIPIGDDPELKAPYGDYFTSEYNAIYNRDLPRLREMGANALRLWGWNHTADHFDFLDNAYNDGVKPLYIIAGFWMNPGLDIDPNSPGNVRERIKSDFRSMVATHKNHPAILMWCIGDELNASSMYGGNLEHLFTLIDEMAGEAHAEEGATSHPVMVALLEESLIDTISAYEDSVPGLDVWGLKASRGNSFGALFSDYQRVSRKPLMVLDFGIDAYDRNQGEEYEKLGRPYQAEYAESLWNEIVDNVDICLGGSIMAYSDEWWMGRYSSPSPGCPDHDPADHSVCGYPASSHPDGYANEEWWGIMRTVQNGSDPDILEPRAVYYKLKDLWSGASPETISSPSTPWGSTSGYSGNSYTYWTGGSTCSAGDPVQYLFDWGDGTDSGWRPLYELTASRSWATGGTYKVRVQARCSAHPSVVSSWSSELSVTILTETVSTPSTPNGSTNGYPGTSYTYWTLALHLPALATPCNISLPGAMAPIQDGSPLPSLGPPNPGHRLEPIR